jgi:Flp pilus assembly protein TadG
VGGRLIKRWVRRDDGTTAIEFSLLAIPYLMLTLGIIELSLMFTSASMLEAATSNTARLIRTGQLQQSSEDPAVQLEAFREALCRNAAVLIPCDNIFIEVVNMGGFGSFNNFTPQFDEDGNLVPRPFDAGGSGDVMMVRTAFQYRMMTPLVGPLLSGPDGQMLFMSTFVMQTEPYEFDGSET